MAAVIFTAVMLMITNSGTVAENTSMNCNQSMIIVNSSTYTCEGYSQIYECTVDRESATIWSGSAFDCPATNNEIIFLHSAPNAFNASCNGGKITGHIIRSANDSYTSRISVSVSSEMIGHNISCFSDGQAGTVLIGSTDLILTTDPLPPPDDICLVSATKNALTLQWTSVSPTCAAIQYSIEQSNCGDCPNVTDQTTIACTSEDGYAEFDGQQCRLTVRTTVCDVTGNQSEEVIVMLKVPDAPTITARPKYAYSSNKLSSIITSFSESKPVNISEDIDGSTLLYTINYTNSMSGVVCKSIDIPASECANGKCEHDEMTPFEIPACPDLRHISVTVSATNLLGTGQPSSAITLDTTNQFVGLSFDMTSKTFTCTFPSQQQTALKWCNISYGLPQVGMTECYNRNFLANTSTSDSVYLTESGAFESGGEHCFTATAGNDSFSVIVEGTFDAGSFNPNKQTETITLVIAVAIIFIMALLGTAILTVLLIKRRKLKCLHRTKTNSQSREPPTRLQLSIPRPWQETAVGANEQVQDTAGVYSLLQSPQEPKGVSPPRLEAENVHNGLVYVEVGPSTATGMKFRVLDYDDKVEYAEIRATSTTGSRKKGSTCDDQLKFPKTLVPVEQISEAQDKQPQVDLDNVLMQIRDEVAPLWREFGEAVGVPKEILDKCSERYQPYQCLVEVVDYWLSRNQKKITWKDVAQAVTEIKLVQLAEKLLCINYAGTSASRGLSTSTNFDDRDQRSTLAGQISSLECTQQLPPPLPPKLT